MFLVLGQVGGSSLRLVISVLKVSSIWECFVFFLIFSFYRYAHMRVCGVVLSNFPEPVGIRDFIGRVGEGLSGGEIWDMILKLFGV